MDHTTVQVVELGGANDFNTCKIVADRKRIIRKVSVVSSTATATSDVSNYRDFHLRNYTDSANIATRSTFSAGAADDVVAATEYELTVSTFEVDKGDVIGLFCDETGTAVDLSAASVTLKVEWI
jgi:hypothetical protein